MSPSTHYFVTDTAEPMGEELYSLAAKMPFANHLDGAEDSPNSTPSCHCQETVARRIVLLHRL